MGRRPGGGKDEVSWKLDACGLLPEAAYVSSPNCDERRYTSIECCRYSISLPPGECGGPGSSNYYNCLTLVQHVLSRDPATRFQSSDTAMTNVRSSRGRRASWHAGQSSGRSQRCNTSRRCNSKRRLQRLPIPSMRLLANRPGRSSAHTSRGLRRAFRHGHPTGRKTDPGRISTGSFRAMLRSSD